MKHVYQLLKLTLGLAEDIISSRKALVKLVPKENIPEASCLAEESKWYEELGRSPGIPRMLSAPWHSCFEILILELLGCDIGRLLEACGGSFSLKTTLLLADQMLARVHTVHKHGFVHRDIRPENFVLGTGKAGNRVYILDFGITHYASQKTRKGVPGIIGTLLFASRSAHYGEGRSKYDDLESLAYMLIYFQKSLPWADCDDQDEVRAKKEKMRNKTIAKGTEAVFAEFLQYARQRRRGEPAYAHWRRNFQRVYRTNCGRWDFRWDWTVQMHADLSNSLDRSAGA